MSIGWVKGSARCLAKRLFLTMAVGGARTVTWQVTVQMICDG
jgi:hypothetical protein